MFAQREAKGMHLQRNLDILKDIYLKGCTFCCSKDTQAVINRTGECNYTLSPVVAFVQVCDVLCCLLFMAFYWNFSREIVKVEERITRENVTPADYAVEVRGLPENASDEVRTRNFPCVQCRLCFDYPNKCRCS